ncbi:MAG: hypothetical protein WC595_04215 [Candidatus Nanoarchaeia archaeon]
MKKSLIFLLVLIFLLSCQTKANCTLDAKLCPDGSAVGRVLPNCEFAHCPEKKMMSNEIESNVITSSAVKEITEPIFISVSREVVPELITVKKGNKLKLVFSNDLSVANYDKIEVKSPYFRTGHILAGESATVEVVADQSFTFRAYRASSTILIGSGQVVVTG